MVQLTRIYTRSGDNGRTSLGNGQRVNKNSLRIEAIGSVDELNSTIGVALLYIQDEKIFSMLRKIQNNLFDVGADLCVPDLDEQLDYKPLRVKQDQIDVLEQAIDQFNADLNPLKSFILPGGTKASAYLHLSRTVTRRAERLICSLKDDEPFSKVDCVLKYMNRLSDLLFVFARHTNKQGTTDILWQPGQ